MKKNSKKISKKKTGFISLDAIQKLWNSVADTQTTPTHYIDYTGVHKIDVNTYKKLSKSINAPRPTKHNKLGN